MRWSCWSLIGIIALLISILLPALNKARQQAVTIKCLSNLRQIGIGIVMYANDNQNLVVPQDYSNGMDNFACILIASRYLPNNNIRDGAGGIITNSPLWCPASNDIIQRVSFGLAGNNGVPSGSPFGALFTTGWRTAGPADFTDGIGAGTWRCQSSLTIFANPAQNWSWCDTSYGINGTSTPAGPPNTTPTIPAVSYQLYSPTANPGNTVADFSPPKMTNARKSSEIVLLYDGIFSNLKNGGTSWARVNARHGNKQTNVLFLDGHGQTYATGTSKNPNNFPATASAYGSATDSFWTSHSAYPKWRFDQ